MAWPGVIHLRYNLLVPGVEFTTDGVSLLNPQGKNISYVLVYFFKYLNLKQQIIVVIEYLILRRIYSMQ